MSQSTEISPLRILHLEDNLLDAELVQAMVEAEAPTCDIHRVERRDDFLEALNHRELDLIISDHSLPSYDGISALALAREVRPSTPFIFFSGTIGEEAAIESLRNGATDYVLKQRPDRLLPAIARAVKEAKERGQRHAAEDRLRQSEARFRMFMGHSPSVAFIKDEAGHYLYFNHQMEHVFELPSDKMVGKTDYDLLPPDAARELCAHDKRVLDSQQPLEVIEVIPSADGSLRHFLVSKFPLPDAVGDRLLGGVAIDITQRLKDEQQLRELAAMVDKAQDAICVVDWEQRILYWNKAAERLYEWPVESALSQRADQLFFPEKAEVAKDILMRIKDAGEWSGELQQKSKSGHKLTVQSRWTLIRNERGEPKNILIINTDITEKRLMESQLLRAQRMENIGTLAGGIAHDLNNVLAPILMAVDLLRDEQKSDGDRKVLETIRISAERGAGMVQQILSFARGLSGEHTALNIKHLVNDMASFARETFPKSIRIEVQTGKDIALVKGDATQLHQVLLNLCINARDAMPNGGSLRIELANTVMDQAEQLRLRAPTPGNYVCLTVIDAGTGMPPELLTKIFEPFFTTKEAGKGTGLGLSTVNGIIKAHNGTLEVESHVNQGTTFKIYLPSTETAEKVTRSTQSLEMMTGHGELLLLVDDEAAILEINKTTLESFNYRVLTAKHGADAVTIYQKQGAEIGLVLTDMMMPVMDGFTLVKQLREIDPQVKAICITGFASHTRVSKVQALQAQGLLNKPYTIEQLLLAIRAALDSKPVTA